MKDVWHIHGKRYSPEYKRDVSIDYSTANCDNIHDAIKVAEEYGIKDITKVFKTNGYKFKGE